MNPPVLHLMGAESEHLCKLIEDGSNWPEKYMDDEVARFLEFCELCETNYVKKHGQENMDKKKAWLRRDMKQDSEECPCGSHPEGMVLDRSPTTPITKKKVKTLREYLGVRA